ncbi:MAG: hypothetical protein M0T82_18175 [Desulfobacteraceae bacterium]|nr:hypothetical protein [Desulfobacteraceae bacterium]
MRKFLILLARNRPKMIRLDTVAYATDDAYINAHINVKTYAIKITYTDPVASRLVEFHA